MLKLPTTNPIRHGPQRSFLQPALNDCKYVFIRVDHVRTPLKPSYEVVDQQDKYFIVKVSQSDAKISIDRLKADYIFSTETAPMEHLLLLTKAVP